MSRYLLLYFFLLFSTGLAHSQTLKGRVLSGEEGLEFANVWIKELNIGAVTDSLGDFSIKVSESGKFS